MYENDTFIHFVIGKSDTKLCANMYNTPQQMHAHAYRTQTQINVPIVYYNMHKNKFLHSKCMVTELLH